MIWAWRLTGGALLAVAIVAGMKYFGAARKQQEAEARDLAQRESDMQSEGNTVTPMVGSAVVNENS